MRSIRAGFGARSRGVSMENEEPNLSPEAAAAIGAGDKDVAVAVKTGEVPANVANGEDPVAGNMDGTKGPEELKEKTDVGSSAVKKEGEVDPQPSNGADPTAAVATGGEGQPPELVGTAGALESRGAAAPKRKFAPIQRARIKVALEDAGMTSEEAEAEIRKQEDEFAGEPAAAAEPARAEGRAEGREPAPEVPAVEPTPEVIGDPAEVAAGAEAAAGREPGEGGEGAAAAPEVPAAGEPAAAELGAEVVGEAGGAAAGEPAATGEATPEAAGAEGEGEIDPVELENARRLVARAEEREVAARGEGRPAAEVPAEPEAREGAAALPTEVEAGAEEVEDNANGLETELLEVVDADMDVSEVNERVEEGEEVVEALEAYRETLKTAMESGGLDRHGAAVYRLGVENLCKSIKFPVPHQLSLESFGGSSKKIHATQLSVESLGETIKAIWEKIIQAIQHSVALMQQLGDKLYNAAGQLEGRALKLGEAAAATEGSPSVREFEDESVARALVIDGKVPADASAVKAVVAFAREMYRGYPQSVAACDKLAALVDQALQSGDMETLHAEASKIQAAEDSFGPLLKHQRQEGDVSVRETDVLPGNMVVQLEIDPEAMERGAGLKVGVVEAEKAREASNAKVQTLNQAAVQDIAKAVGELAKLIKEAKAEVAKSAAVKKKFIELGKKIASMNADEKPYLRDLRVVVTSAIGGLDQPFKDFNVYALRVGAAALAYGQKSLSQYSTALPQVGKPAGEAPVKA